MSLPARLELQYDEGKSLKWTTLDVVVKTASCEGVGLKLRSPCENPIMRNRRGVLHLNAGGASIEVPCRVAWSASEDGAELDMGMRLDLALARAASRELYSSWIVANIISLRDYVEKQA